MCVVIVPHADAVILASGATQELLAAACCFMVQQQILLLRNCTVLSCIELCRCVYIYCFRGNTGTAGCSLLLRDATAVFAAGKPAQFLRNHATDEGPALRARASAVEFNGPVTMAFNSGGSAGGAVFLQASNINAAASMTDNKLATCNDVRL